MWEWVLEQKNSLLFLAKIYSTAATRTHVIIYMAVQILPSCSMKIELLITHITCQVRRMNTNFLEKEN